MHQHHRSPLRSAPALGILAVASVLLAGCSAQAPVADGEEPQTITFAFNTAGSSDTHIQEAIAAFEEQNPGVVIEQQILPAESFATTIQTQLQGGNAADVFTAYAGGGQVAAVHELAEAGLLLDLEPLDLGTRLPEGVRELFGTDGDYYAIPVSSMPIGFIFDSAGAAELGVEFDEESSFDDLVEACTVAAENGSSIVGLAGTVPTNAAIFAMTIAGSTVYGPEPDWNAQRAADETTFAESEGWLEALEGVEALSEAECFQPGSAGAGFDALVTNMAQGTSLSFVAPGGAARSVSGATQGAIEPIVLPVPSPSGEQFLVQSVDGAIAGNAKTESPELVRELLDFLSSPAGAGVLATTQGAVPAIADTEGFETPAAFAPTAALSAAGNVRPLGQAEWPNPKVYETLGAGVVGILVGSKTPKDVLADLDAAWG